MFEDTAITKMNNNGTNTSIFKRVSGSQMYIDTENIRKLLKSYCVRLILSACVKPLPPFYPVRRMPRIGRGTIATIFPILRFSVIPCVSAALNRIGAMSARGGD